MIEEQVCINIVAKCSCCGNEEIYTLNKEESLIYVKYLDYGRKMGYLQELFPNVPAWIRSGGIDQYSNGFCICPKCYE